MYVFGFLLFFKINLNISNFHNFVSLNGIIFHVLFYRFFISAFYFISTVHTLFNESKVLIDFQSTIKKYLVNPSLSENCVVSNILRHAHLRDNLYYQVQPFIVPTNKLYFYVLLIYNNFQVGSVRFTVCFISVNIAGSDKSADFSSACLSEICKLFCSYFS